MLHCLLSVKTWNTKFPLFYDCRTYENIFRLFDDSANKTKAFNLKVNSKELRLVFGHHVNTECTQILQTVRKCWYSALLCNIHKYNHLVIIIRGFVWDNYFQIMFVINILTFFYNFSLVIKEICACATIKYANL